MATGDGRRRLGALGERLAADHLRAAGYQIVERNFRTRHGELDLIAAGAGVLVFCEVKTRVQRPSADGPPPLAAVGPGKRRRLRLMARQWLAGREGSERPRTSEIRFDAIGVLVHPSGRLADLHHLEGAF